MKDIILQEYDIIISNGDIQVSDARQQDIELICKAEKGQFYQYPRIGVGIDKQLNGSKTPSVLKGIIRDNLLMDNFVVNQVKIDNNYNIYIDAE
jgi:hypothetical protein